MSSRPKPDGARFPAKNISIVGQSFGVEPILSRSDLSPKM